jgi:hypothetical protein
VEQIYRLYGTNNYTLGTKRKDRGTKLYIMWNKTIAYMEQNYSLYGTNKYTLGTKRKDRGTQLWNMWNKTIDYAKQKI